MRNDAEKRFNEVVADMMSQGWTIDCTRGFNQGSQGETNRIAFTKGKEIKVVWLTDEFDQNHNKEIIKLEIKSYNDLPVWEDITWYNKGEVELTETFVEIESYNRKGTCYIIAEGNESDEILAKRIERRRQNSVRASLERPYMIEKATELLRASGIWGTKNAKVIMVRKSGSGYILNTGVATYHIGRKGIRKF